MESPNSNLDMAIWDRLVIASDDGVMSPRTARAILSMKFGERDHERMRKLAVKNQRLQLTPNGHAEMEGYLRVGMTLAVLWSKARKAIQQNRLD